MQVVWRDDCATPAKTIDDSEACSDMEVNANQAAPFKVFSKNPVLPPAVGACIHGEVTLVDHSGAPAHTSEFGDDRAVEMTVDDPI